MPYRRVEFIMPEDASDLAIARRVKQELGIQGMNVDQWCCADFCWRDGTIGAYADCYMAGELD